MQSFKLMEFIVKKTLTIVFFFMFVSPLMAFNIGGERPSVSHSLFNSLEDLIIEQARKINKTNEEVRIASSEKGWFGGRSEREKALEKLSEQKDQLKNMLSSPFKNINNKYKKYEIKDKSNIEENVKKSNNEIVEIYCSLENSKLLINVIKDNIKKNKNNYVSTIELYEVYKTCLTNIIEMNEAFLNKKAQYNSIIDSYISQISKQKDDVNKILNSTSASNTSNKAMLEGTIVNLNNILKSLNEAKNRLNEQKHWAEINLISLKENISITEITIKTIKITKDKTDIEKTISNDFLKLDYTLPPMIEY